jgi:L-alanine-DL-glutamate epimerase-like enolase superfamily enzyme
MNRGFHVFYLKVGLDIEAELDMVRYVRETVGDRAKIRLDANGAWKVNEAVRNLARLDGYHIDFIEQPVAPDPLTNMQEVRARTPVGICANEGMWTVEESYRQITRRTADVYCFSSYWFGSLSQFQRLGQVAHLEGLQVVEHTHGELGIAAAAAHHLLLTLPNIVDGNQQTAHMMQDDVLKESLPITSAPDWGIPRGIGLCIEVDEEKVGRYHELYRERGQFLPYDATLIYKP